MLGQGGELGAHGAVGRGGRGGKVGWGRTGGPHEGIGGRGGRPEGLAPWCPVAWCRGPPVC